MFRYFRKMFKNILNSIKFIKITLSAILHSEIFINRKVKVQNAIKSKNYFSFQINVLKNTVDMQETMFKIITLKKY